MDIIWTIMNAIVTLFEMIGIILVVSILAIAVTEGMDNAVVRKIHNWIFGFYYTDGEEG